MVKPRTLSHPPIKEAVLEVLFDFADTSNLKFLNEYGKLILSRYSKKENIITINANIDQSNDNVVRNTIGYVYFTENKKTSIQTRLNGFAFAQTNESYTSWEQFKPIAFKELKSFIEFTAPLAVNRFSLRFINEIKIPSTEDLKEYLNLLPSMGTINLPMRNFVSRMELDKPDISGLAIVSQLFSPPFNPTVNFFLDIDVIINENPPKEVSLEYLFERFDTLRTLKNDIFFSALTEKTIDSYS